MRSKWKRPELFDTHGMSPSLRRSLYLVIWAATISMLSNVVTTGAPWTGFQREVLRADDLQLGLIAAIPVATNILQIFISFYMERKRNRRFLFLFFGILGRAMWIVIGLIPLFIPASMQMLRIVTVVMLVGMVSSGNCVVNLGFASLMGDLVPMGIRGAYFGIRQRVSLIASILAGLLVSTIVDRCGAAGYSIVLVLAGLAGCLDLCCFFRVDWPPMEERTQEEQSKKHSKVIGQVFRDGNFMRFTLAFTLWGLVINVPAPFFNVFMLEELHMSYTGITLTNQIVSNIATVLVAAKWGRLLDRFGNKPILLITCTIVALVPLLWMLMGPNLLWLMVLTNAISGCFQPTIDLSQINLYLTLSPQKNRSIYVAVFFVSYNLLGVALGNALGGWLVQDVLAPLQAMGFPLTKYRSVFLVSTLLRLSVALLIFPRMREPGAKGLMEMRDTLRAERGYRHRRG